MNARVWVVALAVTVSVPGLALAQSSSATKSPAAKAAAKPDATTPVAATGTATKSVAASSDAGQGTSVPQAGRTGSRATSGAPAVAPRANDKAAAMTERRTGSRSASGAPATAARASRRLEDIPIEGEIAVPQVLFITARDQRRFVDFQHRRYLRTSLQVGETTRFPSWIAVVPGPKPEDNRKETSR